MLLVRETVIGIDVEQQRKWCMASTVWQFVNGWDGQGELARSTRYIQTLANAAGSAVYSNGTSARHRLAFGERTIDKAK